MSTRGTPAHRAFHDYFHDFCEGCGKPKYGETVEIIKRLDELYPVVNSKDARSAESGLSKVRLSKFTFSRLLNGACQNLPSARTLAALVLSFQHLAAQNGSASEDLGRRTLPEWQELLRQAKKLAQQQADDGIFIDDRLTGAPEAADAPSAGRPPYRVRMADPVRLAPGELSRLMTYGPYAQALAARAAQGHPAALYEIAVILGSRPEYAGLGKAHLMSAAAAGLDRAFDLVPVEQDALELQLVERHARDLARDAAERGDDHAHHAFLSCADQAAAARREAPLNP